MKHLAGFTYTVGVLKHSLGALLPELTIHFSPLFNILNVFFKMTDKAHIRCCLRLSMRHQMTSSINYLLSFQLAWLFGGSCTNFQGTLKIVWVLNRCGMPPKNSSIISNFNWIKEIKRWKNCVIHISNPQVSIV